MTDESERWGRIGEIFFAALEAGADDRAPLLVELTGGDRALEGEVRELLDAHEERGGFDRLADEIGAPRPPAAAGVGAGARVGPYELVEEIGRGGMGAVFRARRADGQFEQEVALKLHRNDVYRDEMRERFLAERQILARISHPNIARLLDGGVAEDGRSYFAMEYVDGLPLDRYCDERRLSIEQRVRMFVSVCDAVQHAHRNLVVHRDLKPSNILVTADGTVKLLDFGIAKLLDAGDAGRVTDATRVGARLLTPEYASPEQILGEHVTTASDVYQLGVLLFELLTGTRPHRLKDATLLEMERVVTRSDAPAPSAVVGRIEPDRPSPADRAAARRTTPERLRRRLAGDLDTVASMAMRREPERRYPSAADLRDEVRRHLEGHPVRARPDRWWYRTHRFVRRNRAAVAALATLFLLVSLFAAERARQARETARALAQAEQVTDFLVSLFQSSSPDVTRGDTVTVRDVLDRGAERVRTELLGEPAVQTRLMSVIAEVYENLALDDEAIALRREVLATRDSVLPRGDADVVMAAVQLAQLVASSGDPREARSALEDAQRRTRTGRLTEAQRARNLNNIGYGWQVLGELDRAEPLLEGSLATYRRRVAETPLDRVAALTNLGNVRLARADPDSAEALFREGLEIRRRLLDPDAPALATSLASLARALQARRDLAGADSASSEALRIRRRIYPDGHPDLYALLTLRGGILHAMGDTSGAEALYREGVEAYARTLTPDDPRLAFARNDFGGLLIDMGRYAEAEASLGAALPVFERRYGPAHLYTAIVRTNLAKAIVRQGRAREAEPLYATALEGFRAARGRHPSVARALLDWGDARVAAGNLDGALEPLREGLAICLETRGEADFETLRARNTLGATLARLGRFEEGEAQLLAAYGAAPSELRAVSAGLLVALYEAWGRPEEARRYSTGG